MDQSASNQNVQQSAPQQQSVAIQSAPVNTGSLQAASVQQQPVVVQQPVQTDAVQQQSVNKPEEAVSATGPSKEFAPVMSKPQSQEVITPSEQEPDLASEVKEAGVATIPNSEVVAIKPEVKAAGVMPAKTAVPVPTMPTDNLHLPMTEEEAKEIIRTHKPSDSIRWLATLTEMIIDQGV